MDALQAYQSSDSEDDNDTYPKTYPSQSVAQHVELRVSLNSDSKLPKPDLNFRVTGRNLEEGKTILHSMLPWSKPTKRKECGELKERENTHCQDNGLAVYFGKIQQETDCTQHFMHSRELGPQNPHQADSHVYTESCSAIATPSHQSTSVASDEMASRSRRTFCPSTSVRRSAVTQPYIPKRLRQSHQESMGSVVNNSHSESARGKLREMMYTTPPSIALQIDRRLTSKLPRRRASEFHLHTGPVTHIRWCAAQSYSHLLLSSSMDKTVRIWNGISKDGCCLKTLNCHMGAVKDAQWGRGGFSVLSCGYDKTARLCDVESGNIWLV